MKTRIWQLYKWITEQRGNVCDKRGSDFGRKFGWEVIFDGVHVADLEYAGWNPSNQFWQAYKIIWCTEDHELPFPKEHWSNNGVILISRKFREVLCRDFLSADPTKEKDMISLRGVYVPDEYLK
jgi:hypothetical protein